MSSVDDIFKEMQENDRRSRAKKVAATGTVTNGLSFLSVKDEKKSMAEEGTGLIIQTIDRTSAALLEPSNVRRMARTDTTAENKSAAIVDASRKLSANCAREINILQGSDNRERKQVLESLYSVVEAVGEAQKEGETPAYSEQQKEDFDTLMQSLDDLLKPLLLRLEDPIERCRELSIKCLTGLLSKSDGASIEGFLPYIIPIIMERVGEDPVKEKSEEIRLELFHLVTTVINLYGDRLGGHIDFLVSMVLRNSQDTNPDVRKKLCEMCLALTKTVPGVLRVPIDQDKNNRAIALVHYLAPSLSHKHASVRVATLEAVESLVMLAAGAAIEHLIGWRDPNVIPILTFYGKPPEQINYFGMLATDNNVMVRERFYKMLARWMLHHEQRWDYERRMVPFMLTAVADEAPHIATFGFETFERLGRVYEEEKEEDFVEQYRYNDDAWGETEEAIKVVSANLPHPFAHRPRIGARVIVRGNVKKFLGALASELADWKAKPKASSVRMLRVVFIYCEEYITSLLDTFLPALCKICTDPERGQQILDSVVTLGAYVPVHAWLPLLTPHALGEFIDDTTYQMQVLQVVAALIRGTHPTRLYKHIPAILDLLAAPALIDSQSTDLKLALADVLYALVNTRGFDVERETPRLVWIHLLSHSSVSPGNAGYNEIVSKAERGLEQLNTIWKANGGVDVLSDHFSQLMEHVARDYKDWSSYTRELQIFEFMVGSCTTDLGKYLETVLAIVFSLLREEKERSVRLRAMVLVRHLAKHVPSGIWQHENELFEALMSSVFSTLAGTPSTQMLNCALDNLNTLVGAARVQRADKVDSGCTGLIDAIEVARDDTRKKVVSTLTLLVEEYSAAVCKSTLEAAVDVLLRSLNDKADDVRVESARSLGKLAAHLSRAKDETVRRALSTMILLLSGAFDPFQEELQHALADMADAFPRQFAEEGEAKRSQLEAGRCISLLEKAKESS